MCFCLLDGDNTSMNEYLTINIYDCRHTLFLYTYNTYIVVLKLCGHRAIICTYVCVSVFEEETGHHHPLCLSFLCTRVVFRFYCKQLTWFLFSNLQCGLFIISKLYFIFIIQANYRKKTIKSIMIV